MSTAPAVSSSQRGLNCGTNCLQARAEGVVVAALHEGDGVRHLAPRGEERVERGDREARTGQRQDDAPEGAERAEPVERGGLVELARDGVEVAAQHPRAERHRDGEVGDDQRRLGVDEPEVGHDRVDRHDEDRHREHLGEQEDPHQAALAGEVEAAQRVARGRRHRDADHHGEGRDDHRVEEPGGEVGVGEQACGSCRAWGWTKSWISVRRISLAGLIELSTTHSDREERREGGHDERAVQRDAGADRALAAAATRARTRSWCRPRTPAGLATTAAGGIVDIRTPLPAWRAGACRRLA